MNNRYPAFLLPFLLCCCGTATIESECAGCAFGPSPPAGTSLCGGVVVCSLPDSIVSCSYCEEPFTGLDAPTPDASAILIDRCREETAASECRAAIFCR